MLFKHITDNRYETTDHLNCGFNHISHIKWIIKILDITMLPSHNLGEIIPQYSTVAALFYLLVFFMTILAYDYQEDFEPTPYFIPQPNNVTFNVGQLATLLCSVENLGKKFVVWRKASDPHPISVGEIIYAPDTRYAVGISKERREYNLQIHNVQPMDAGVYHCQISSKDKIIRHIMLNVVGRASDSPSGALTEEGKVRDRQFPTPEIVLTGKKFVNSGETIRLVCNVSGNSDIPQDIDWYKDGRVLKQFASPKINIRNDISLSSRKLDSVLEIYNSNDADSGTYVCRNSEDLIASQAVIVLNEEKANTDKRGTAAEAKSGQMCNKQWWTLFLSVFLTAITTKVFVYLS